MACIFPLLTTRFGMPFQWFLLFKARTGCSDSLFCLFFFRSGGDKTCTCVCRCLRTSSGTSSDICRATRQRTFSSKLSFMTISPANCHRTLHHRERTHSRRDEKNAQLFSDFCRISKASILRYTQQFRFIHRFLRNQHLNIKEIP